MDMAKVRIDADPFRLKSLKSYSLEDVQTLSHRTLRAVPDFGSFFVSLADVTRLPSQEVSRRLRQAGAHQRQGDPNYVTGENLGLSSPISASRATSVISSCSIPENKNDDGTYPEIDDPSNPTPDQDTEWTISVVPALATITGLNTNMGPPERVGPGVAEPAVFQPRAENDVNSSFSPDQPADYEEQIDRTKHEAVSANMASQFISTIVDLYSNEPGENAFITEFFLSPNTFKLVSPHLNCTCQDDGGLWRIQFDNRAWINKKSELVCSLEVKSSYSQADSSGNGAISHTTLAQQFCELLGSVMSLVVDEKHEELDAVKRRRFLISVHQTDITIVYCNFSSKYLRYIYSKEPLSDPPHITLHQSCKFDLSDPTGRREAAEAIIALNEYFDAN
ncbi:hypothetical protein SBOR_8359 [Sclerotinia borealis F-4128]|uniref:Uncharacterized protein n=1 Tax=Sclerotinia borealis (strain F-4128) TaxID=1432307 RepID=W9C5W3_SCLBF|nr:hypothetical protein SBOR_8359 [Sclerotinia borealis F-4128]